MESAGLLFCHALPQAAGRVATSGAGLQLRFVLAQATRAQSRRGLGAKGLARPAHASGPSGPRGPGAAGAGGAQVVVVALQDLLQCLRPREVALPAWGAGEGSAVVTGSPALHPAR